jgi:hypothetical protein
MTAVDDLATAWRDDDRDFDVDGVVAASLAVSAAVASAAADAGRRLRRGLFALVVLVGFAGAVAALAAFDTTLATFRMTTALVVPVAGAVAALAFVLYARRRPPTLLLRRLAFTVFGAGAVVVAASCTWLALLWSFGDPLDRVLPSFAGENLLPALVVFIGAAVLTAIVEAGAPPESASGGHTPLVVAGGAFGSFTVDDGGRRERRILLALMALSLAPGVFDAVAVVTLQAVPAMIEGIYWKTPHIVHIVLPVLPIVLAAIAAVVTPPLFAGAAGSVPHGFVGRATPWALVPLLWVPVAVSLSALVLDPGEFNLHLWSYAVNLDTVRAAFPPEADFEVVGFPRLSLFCLPVQVVRFGVLVVLATGLARAIGRGRLVAAVLVLDVVVWVVTFFVGDNPAPVRAAVALAAAVALLLVAVTAPLESER